MNKTLKKAVEAELNSLITTALATRNKAAAASVMKHIREGVKTIAKKFVKSVPKPTLLKKKGKKIAEVVKVAASPKKTVKKVALKTKRVKEKK